MKTLEELKNTPRLVVGRVGADGGSGEVHLLKWVGSVIWSFGGGWEHVSVSPYKRHIIPSWDDMCAIKNMFFRDDEVVVQYHPAKSEYVNVVENCLHLWRPLEAEMPVPNSLMVGLKKGQGVAEIKEYVRELEKDNTSTEHINKLSDCSTNWIPCSERLPEEPGENPEFDGKPLELYLVSFKGTKYPWRAFWNGKNFTDGWSIVHPEAWMPLPEPYKPEKGE